jgi:hypothetical protein
VRLIAAKFSLEKIGNAPNCRSAMRDISLRI